MGECKHSTNPKDQAKTLQKFQFKMFETHEKQSTGIYAGITQIYVVITEIYAVTCEWFGLHVFII